MPATTGLDVAYDELNETIRASSPGSMGRKPFPLLHLLLRVEGYGPDHHGETEAAHDIGAACPVASDQRAYRNGLNRVSRYAFDNGKISTASRLQKATNADLRARYGLPAQMACNNPRQVAAAYKGFWTKVKANTKARTCGRTKKRYKGLDKPPTYSQPTLTYNYGRDYGFKSGGRVSILTLEGRLMLPYSGYDTHIALIRGGKPWGRPSSGTTSPRSGSTYWSRSRSSALPPQRQT